MIDFLNQYAEQISQIQVVLLFITALVHVIFAGAVAKDAGDLVKVGQKPLLVTGLVWAFATLVGGVVVAAIYWFMHHSTLTRI